MNRPSRFDRRRGTIHRSAHRIVSTSLAVLLIAMLASAAVIGRGPSAARAQAATPVTASVTPETALLYIAIDLDTTSPQYVKATELLQRIGVDASVEDLAGQVTSSMTEGTTVAGSQLAALLGGEAGIAYFDLGDLSSLTGGTTTGFDDTATPAAVPTESFAVIISAPDPDAAFAAAEAALQDDATTQGATISEETYEGIQIKSIPGDELAGTTGSALARVGDFIVIGTQASDIEPVADTQAGRTPSLADSADFKATSADLNAEWIAMGHVNGSELASQIDAAAATTGASVASVDVAQLSADTGYVIWADDPGFRIDAITLAAPDAAPVVSNFDMEFPGRIPGDALFVTGGADLGATGIIDTIFLSVLTGLTGSIGGDVATPDPSKSAEQIAAEQFAQLELLLGFNVKTDFIDQMVGEWGLALWGLDANAMAGDLSGVKFLVVSNAQTPATVADASSKLSLLIQAGLAGQGTVTTRVVGSDTIQVLTIDDGSGAPPQTVEYGVVEGRFFISYNGAIDDYLTGTGSSLADNPSYQAALAELPADHNGILYVDLNQSVAIIEAAIASFSAGFTTLDASEKCAEYSTQAAAQEAFDADPATLWELDQDFDGEACEDFFNPATPAAAATPMAAQYAALKAFVTVTYERDGMTGVSSLVLIEA
jgi:hypothetical protein